MFNFFQKKNPDTKAFAYFPFYTDIHSHILPGIDDGSPDIETSLELIKGMCALGIRKCIATPHIISDLYRNDANTISTALERLKIACLQNEISMELDAAAEYMLDDYFLNLLREKKALLTLHKNLLLTEFPFSIVPTNIEETVFNILTAGYQPILAHPERYHYFHHKYDTYYKLKELGFQLQINLLSITGYYGPAVKKAVQFILKNKLAVLCGTDLHHHKHLSALADVRNRALFQEYFSETQWNQLDTLVNK